MARITFWLRVKRSLFRLIVFVFTTLLVGAVYQFLATKIDDRKYPAPGRMVDIGGYSLHLNCIGEGAPTVILDAGLGTASLDWSLIQSEVGRTSRVCSYDRAGLGWSDSGPKPRNSQQIVNELYTLLDRAGIQPPFILVGHSFGGLNMQLYASNFPDEVAGMVLVDSSHENQSSYKELSNLPSSSSLLLKVFAPIGGGRLLLKFLQPSNIPSDISAERNAIYSRTRHMYSAADEYFNLEISSKQLRDNPMQLGSKPLIVLTRGNSVTPPSSVSAERRESIWLKLQADLVTRSSNGRHIIADKSNHFIQFDQPHLVVGAIRQIIEDVRQQKPES